MFLSYFCASLFTVLFSKMVDTLEYRHNVPVVMLVVATLKSSAVNVGITVALSLAALLHDSLSPAFVEKKEFNLPLYV